MSERRACRLRVHGVVQGVGYREGLRWAAEAHGVVGWVRNRADGTVEAVIEGPSAALDAVVAWAKRGPRAGRVDRVEVTPEPVSGLEGFERLPTA
jgi:acylphosphatase